LRRLVDRDLLLCAALFALIATGTGLAQPPSGNVIAPDGRTQTTLKSIGSSTSISTGTMAGGNAYNSFSQFKVGAATP
jgi:hypothetical protein